MNTSQCDERNNLVMVSLFETHLAKFVLEHPTFYQALYIKVLHVIEALLSPEQASHSVRRQCAAHHGPQYDCSRHLFMIFSQLEEAFPGQNSYDTLKTAFHLSPVDYFIKLILDHFLTLPAKVPNFSPTRAGDDAFFSSASFVSRRSPFKPSRSPLLFSASNRGVFELENEEDEDWTTQAIGIVSDAYLPTPLMHYFDVPIRAARFNYIPNEESHVAKWLRKRNLPVISGSSGSTEGLINFLFPLCALSTEEKQMLIFTQACNMVAHGHHSFFEAMIVADHLGFTLEDQETLLDYYLQCIPDSIRTHEAFMAFLDADLIRDLDMTRALYPIKPEDCTPQPYTL